MNDANVSGPLASLLCFHAYALNRSFARFYQAAFGESGLTYPKFIVLTALKDFGPMTVSELSARAAVEPNTLSPLLKKMASFDLINRERAEEDERRVVLSITEKGSTVLSRAHAVAMQGFEALGLDADGVEQAVAFMRDARKRVDATRPPQLYFGDL